jgi:hypothetical protein
VPVVATAAAARGLEARRDEHFLVEDEPARFAEAVVGLLRDRDARRRLAARARSFVEAHHSWPVLLARIESLVVDAAARRTAESPVPRASSGLSGIEVPGHEPSHPPECSRKPSSLLGSRLDRPRRAERTDLALHESRLVRVLLAAVRPERRPEVLVSRTPVTWQPSFP